MRRRGGQQSLVGVALLLDPRGVRERAQVEKLGAEESDPLRVVPVEGSDLLGELEVRAHHDPHSVPRGSGARRPGPLTPRPVAPLADPKKTPAQPLLGRVRLDRSPIPVDDDRFLGRDGLADTRDSDDRREPEGAGDDRRVRRESAAFEHERADPPGVQPRRVDRRDLVGHENGSSRQLLGKDVFPAGQVAGDLARHVVDVRGPFAHGVGVRGLETFSELPGDLREGPLRVDAVAPDPVQHRIQVSLVRGDQPVRFQDRGELRSDVAGSLARVAPELLRGETRSPAQPLLLDVELVGCDGPAKRGETAEAHDDRSPDRDPRGNGKALEHGFRRRRA